MWLRPFSASVCNSARASPDLRGWQGHGLDSGPHWGRTRTVRTVPSDGLLYDCMPTQPWMHCKASNQLEQNVGKVRILGLRSAQIRCPYHMCPSRGTIIHPRPTNENKAMLTAGEECLVNGRTPTSNPAKSSEIYHRFSLPRSNSHCKACGCSEPGSLISL